MLSYYLGKSIIRAGGLFIRKFDSGKQLKYSLPVILCAALVFCPWPLIGSYKLQNNILRWTPTECKIINSTIGEQRSRHVLDIVVAYNVNQELIYSSTTVCRWSSIYAFNRCLEVYPDNSTMTCIYNPDDPTTVESFSDNLKVLISKFALSVELFTLFPVLLVFVLSWQSVRAIIAFFWITMLILLSPILRAKYKDSNLEPREALPEDSTPTTDASYSEWFLFFRSFWNIACGLPRTKVLQTGEDLTKLFPMNDCVESPELKPTKVQQHELIDSLEIELELNTEDFCESEDHSHHEIEEPSVHQHHPHPKESFKVQYSILEKYSQFCTSIPTNNEQILWIAEPFIFNQVLSVEYLLKWLFGFLMVAFLYYSFYVGLLFGIEVPADYIALYTGYSIFLLVFVPGIAWELIEPWFMRTCYIVTSKRMARLTQFSLGDIPWRRELVQLDSILEERGVFVRPRRWDVFDVEVQCSTSKGWFQFKDLDLEDVRNLKSALRKKWKSKP